MDAQGNSYAAARRCAWERYAPWLDGNEDGLFCVLCPAGLADAAREALSRTAERLGYAGGPTFVACDAPWSGAGGALGPAEAFELVEGLDPLCVVAADEACTLLLSEAFRTLVEPLAPARVANRDVRAFGDLRALLATDAGKQKAWSLLKTLPRL